MAVLESEVERCAARREGKECCGQKHQAHVQSVQSSLASEVVSVTIPPAKEGQLPRPKTMTRFDFRRISTGSGGSWVSSVQISSDLTQFRASEDFRRLSGEAQSQVKRAINSNQSIQTPKVSYCPYR